MVVLLLAHAQTVVPLLVQILASRLSHNYWSRAAGGLHTCA
jgi:hypothetical protein